MPQPSNSLRPQYRGPKDVGRAESLFRSALSKPDLDYSAQLLFLSLIANPEHESAFAAILAKIAMFAAGKRKMLVRVADQLTASPADPFIRALAAYCASPRVDEGLTCATEAQKIGLPGYADTLGRAVLAAIEAGDAAVKSSAVVRLIEIFESCGDLENAVAAVRHGTRLFPDDHAFRVREKNLLASKYIKETDLADSGDYREQLRDRERQESRHRPQTPAERIDEIEQRYRQTSSLEDFRELVRALRDSSASRREAALAVMEDGLQRFGEKETRWFIREVRLERKLSELRVHQKLVDENPDDAALQTEHESMRRAVLGEQIDHLYEVVTALPNTPERHKRHYQLAAALFDAGRFEEAIKQAQIVRRHAENRIDAWVVMAKSFVQLGLTMEAGDCFQHILSELNSSAQSSIDRVLAAKYAYAEFLVQEAEKSADRELARQARKLCADVMIDDIDYRDVRTLAARVDRIPGAQKT